MEALPMRAARGQDPNSPGDVVPLWRLHARRAVYPLLVLELSIEVWPDPLPPSRRLKLMQGVVSFVLGTLFVLALIGLRYLLRMLPPRLF